MAKRFKAHAIDTSTPVFTVVRLVCSPEASVAALAHVVISVSDFLGRICADWTLESESSSGKIWRLNLLAGTEWPGVGQLFRKARFEYALREAVFNSNIDVLQWWMQHYGLPEWYGHPKARVFARAVQYSSLCVLEWLRAQGNLPTGPLKTSVVCRHLAIAQWIHLHVPSTRMAIELDTDLDFIQWTHEHQHQYKIKNMSYLIERAVALGKLAELQWLLANRPERCADNALRRALKSGHLDLAAWLRANHPPGYFQDPVDIVEGWSQIQWISAHYDWKDANMHDKWVRNCIGYEHRDAMFAKLVKHFHANRQIQDFSAVMRNAASRGDLAMVQWLHEHQANANTDAIDFAVFSGHLRVVEWLHSNRTEGCTAAAMDSAARNNRFAMVEWLHTNRAEGCTPGAMDGAAQNGHLRMVQWLHANRSEGCTTNAMDSAAAAGNLEMVQWLHFNRTEGCTPAAMDEASYFGRLEMVQWLHVHRAEGCMTRAMDHAKSLSVVKYLHVNRLGECTTRAMDRASQQGNLELVQWLHHNRSEGCTTEAMDKAAKNGHLEIVRFLHEHRMEGCTTDAMDNAAKNGHFEIVRYLHEHRHEGCTARTWAAAANHENWAFVEWLCQNRLGGGTGKCIARASSAGSFDTVKLLTLEGKMFCDSEQLREIIIYYDRFDIVEWLLKQYDAFGHVVVDNPYIDR